MAKARLSEFGLISEFMAPLARSWPGAFNLRDDAAIIQPRPGWELVVTSDAMVEDVHFRAREGAGAVASKLLRVNLSDLAAKGARPLAYQLILGLPRMPQQAWLRAFCDGLWAAQQEFGCQLSGGDTVRVPGRLVVSVTMFGEVPEGLMLRRSGGRAGDDVYLSGTIGDAALGLATRLDGQRFPRAAKAHFLERLDFPTPRLALGQSLRGVASAAMDVSDGLAQDAGHLAKASGVGLEIDVAALPLSPPAAAALARAPQLLERILSGGDDYEILFAAPPEAARAVQFAGEVTGTTITRIGRLRRGRGVVLRNGPGLAIKLRKGGFQHF